MEEKTAEKFLEDNEYVAMWSIQDMVKAMNEYATQQTAGLRNRIAFLEKEVDRVFKINEQLESHKQPQVSGDVEQAANNYADGIYAEREYENGYYFDRLEEGFIAAQKCAAAHKPNWIRCEDLQKVIEWIERDRDNLVSMSGINPGSVAYDTCVSRLKALLPTPPNKEAAE